ncbi:hypothetical protein PIB30_005778 [Stylosanthes scabra]|uniref:phosphopantothenoylcysteine decarboxylase n=1 Tax=Stylosanthes scabra TaxID=79078 RepID=A0ABU6X1X6_9FABA|nr:hypothetical protein [Stylosanthes scabra]
MHGPFLEGKSDHIQKLHNLGIIIITVFIEKPDGKMPEPDEILDFVKNNTDTVMASIPEEDVGQNFTTNESSTMNSAGPGPARRKPRVLLAACGCYSATKFRQICQCFITWSDVKAVLTKEACYFVDASTFPYDSVRLHFDNQQWTVWETRGSSLHIELYTWADIIVIAPMSADTIAKMLGGFCDNLLTTIIRLWDCKKPLYVAPSMDPFMWNNPLTARQLQSLGELGSILITKIGEVTDGEHMTEPAIISEFVKLHYILNRPAE